VLGDVQGQRHHLMIINQVRANIGTYGGTNHPAPAALPSPT